MSWVRPGVLLAKASRRRPVSALMALDLPAFERPAKAIPGAPGGGSSRGSCTEIVNVAEASGSPFSASRLAAARRATVKSAGFVASFFFPRGFRMRASLGFAGLMAVVYAGAALAAAPAAKPDLA